VSDARLRLVSALVAAVVSASFVAASGAAILWERFEASGLPASQAISVTPDHELVAVGGVALVGFMIAGIVALVAVYAIDNSGTPGAHTRRGLVTLMIAEVVVAILVIQSDWWLVLLLALAFATAGVFIVYLLDDAATALASAPDDEALSSRGWLERAYGWVKEQLFGAETGVSVARIATVVLLLIGVYVVGWADQWVFVVVWAVPTLIALLVLAHVDPDHATLRRVVAVALIVYGLIALIRFDHPVAALAIAALLLTLVNLGVATATGNRFALYGVAVFLSVVLFGGLLSYIRTRDEPKLQGVAALMKDGHAECGLYVTETDSRLYLARVDAVLHGRKTHIVEGSGRIFWLPRDQIQRTELGPLQGVINAQANGVDLRDELQRDAAANSDQAAQNPGPPRARADGCSPAPGSPPPRTTARRKLAEQYQPRVVLDRSDGFWPISALIIFKLRHGGRVTCRRVAPNACIDTRRPSRLPWVGGGAEWLEYPGKENDQTQQHNDMVDALNSSDPVSTAREYFFASHNDSGGIDALQYWFYYEFNYQRVRRAGINLVKAGFHEGDFESMGLVFSSNSEEPRYVWMARHAGEGQPFLWNERQLDRSGDHLTVYAARGSHATYESCGRQRRPVGGGAVDDRTACGSHQLAIEPQITPMSDISLAPWACWGGHFGSAKHASGIQKAAHYVDAGPRSPLWQQNFGVPAAPCASVGDAPARPDLGEEVVDELTADRLNSHGGKLQAAFDSCADWQKPPRSGVYVVVCDQKALHDYFASGLEDSGDARIRIGRLGAGARPAGIPAVYRSADERDVDGVAIQAKQATKASLYAACFSGNKLLAAKVDSLTLPAKRTVVLRTGHKEWALTGAVSRAFKPSTSSKDVACGKS
jgi:hypothetical protein